MHRTPSFIPIYIYPIVVVRGGSPCVHKNLSIATSVMSNNHENSFHTVHTRSTAHSPSCSNNCRTIAQSWARFCHMIRKCFCVSEVPKIAPWLYMIWQIMGMWTSFYDLSNLNQKNTDGPNSLEAHQNLQVGISLGKTTCRDARSSPS